MADTNNSTPSQSSDKEKDGDIGKGDTEKDYTSCDATWGSLGANCDATWGSLAASSPRSDKVEVGSVVHNVDSPWSSIRQLDSPSLSRQYDSPLTVPTSMRSGLESTGMTPVRNPSPPRELQDDLMLADRIGDTVYSKHRLITTLLELIKAVDESVKPADGERSGAEGEGERGMNISEELQNELCELWDMSMNRDVIKILHEFKAVDILTGVLCKSHAPRATEIAIGILGNMACDENMCQVMMESNKLVDVSLMLLEDRDPPTLVETTRFLIAVHACTNSRSAWVKAIKESEETFTNLKFILESSPSEDLVRNAAELVDQLMDCDDELCRKWSGEELQHAVMEAIKQLGSAPSEGLHACLHVLHLLTTKEPGVSAVVSGRVGIIPPLISFLERVCDDDIVVVDDEASSLASVHSVLHTILMSAPDGYDLIFGGSQVIRCALKVLKACCTRPALTSPSATPVQERPAGNEEELSARDSSTVKEGAISRCVYDNINRLVTEGICLLFAQFQRAAGTTESLSPNQDETNGSTMEQLIRKPPGLLTYMNEHCDRSRLLTLIRALQGEDNKENTRNTKDSRSYISMLNLMADKLNLSRLSNILETLKVV